MQGGSERLLKTLASLPRSKPLCVFLPQDEIYSAFVSAIVVYLAWPTQFRWVEVRRDNALRELRAVDPALYGAIVFCGLKPPEWLGPKVAFTSNLSIVPLKQEIETP